MELRCWACLCADTLSWDRLCMHDTVTLETVYEVAAHALYQIMHWSLYVRTCQLT
jgi:hypothetical protein